MDVLQPAYSLVSRASGEAILPFCEKHGIGVIVYSPMGSGLPTGAMTRERVASLPDDDHRRRRPEFQEPGAHAEPLMPWGDRTLGFYVVETAYGPALFDSGRTTGIPALEAGLARSHAEDPHDSP